MIRVLLADDQVLVRSGFRALLDSEEDIEVVGEAGDGREAVTLCRRLLPDVVLMDIRMPELDGLAATPRDRRRGPSRRRPDRDPHDVRARRVCLRGAAGGRERLPGEGPEPEDLIRGVRSVAAGDALLSPSVTRRLIGEFAARAKEARPARELEALTDREREVVALVADGLSNTEIAEHLVMSPATAKTHVSRAMRKLGARDRAQLVVVAYESGLVRPGWLE